MWFHFCTSNHNATGRDTLEDMYNWFYAGLSELGHRVTISQHEIHSDAINIFWENFLPKMGNKIKETNAIYGIVATEIPYGETFNGRSDGPWPLRWKGFSEAATGASFIWTMVESTVPYYSQFAPTAFVELGFSELLIPKMTNDRPDIDFSFFGLRTPYREKVIKKLEKKAKVFCPNKFLSSEEVSNLIARTKVGLSFKQSETWPIPSPTRLGRHLMAKRGLVTEYTPVITRQAQLISVAPENVDFAAFALEKLKTWKEDAEIAFERFRVEMPMKSIMADVLNKTGVLALSERFSKERAIKIVLDPPELIETVCDVNIIYYDECYFCVRQEVGEIDFTQDKNILKEQYKDDIIFASSLMEARKMVKFNLKSYFFKIQSKLKSKLPRLSKDKSVKIVLRPPKLIQTINDVNIVHYDGCYFCVRQKLGEIDLTQDKHILKEQYKDGIIFASSLIEARVRVKFNLRFYLFKILTKLSSKVNIWRG